MTIYLTLEDVLHIHAELIRGFGGAEGVRDLGLVQSALLRPQTGYYDDLIEEAAALWESLGMNHGFVDGNKRVAFACTELFLALNGVAINAPDAEIEAFIYRHLENRSFAKGILFEWLRENTSVG